MEPQPVRSHDLTARTRLRQTALIMFARHGFDGISARAIAQQAGVSPALVTHHFGSKEGLRAAVNEYVLEVFAEEFDELYGDCEAPDLLAAMGTLTARLFGQEHVIRGYLRRILLDDAEMGAEMFGRLLDGARSQLEKLAAAGGIQEGVDLTWAPYEILFLLLGPLLLEPALAAQLGDPFDPALLSARSSANQRLLLSGLFKPVEADAAAVAKPG